MGSEKWNVELHVCTVGPPPSPRAHFCVLVGGGRGRLPHLLAVGATCPSFATVYKVANFLI